MRLPSIRRGTGPILLGGAILIFSPSRLLAAEVRLALRPPGETQLPAIHLLFEGRAFEPALALHQPAAPDALPGELFLRRVIATNREGGVDDLLALWAPSDREAMRPRISGSQANLDRNRSIFRNMKESRLRAEMAYGSYTLYFVEHVLTSGQSFFNIYPTLRTQDQVFLTTRLESDATFSALRLLAPGLDWTTR